MFYWESYILTNFQLCNFLTVNVNASDIGMLKRFENILNFLREIFSLTYLNNITHV